MAKRAMFQKSRKAGAAPIAVMFILFLAACGEGPQDGEDGAPGAPGSTGAQGEQGPVGPQGPAGQNGQPGAAGPQGPAGQDGQDGQNGQPGPAGPQGPEGPEGPQGEPGEGINACQSDDDCAGDETCNSQGICVPVADNGAGGAGGNGGEQPQPDRDGDDVPDDEDNCPRDANKNQADRDGDDVGDVCDNCPSVANAAQADSDEDGIGDRCEPECDGNDDCANGQICSNGQCVAPDQCDANNDCEVGEACQNGRCVNLCERRVCVTPPADECLNGTTLLDYNEQGTCDGNDGSCDYVAEEVVCPRGCSNGRCNPAPVDRDGDGFSPEDNDPARRDCDDRNNTVFPGAAEICGDGLDNNCSGNEDELCEPIEPRGPIVSVECLCGDVDGSGNLDAYEISCNGFQGCQAHVHHWSERPGDTDSYNSTNDPSRPNHPYSIQLSEGEACGWGHIKIKTRMIENGVATRWYGDPGAPSMDRTVRVRIDDRIVHDPTDLNPRLPRVAVQGETNDEGNFVADGEEVLECR